MSSAMWPEGVVAILVALTLDKNKQRQRYRVLYRYTQNDARTVPVSFEEDGFVSLSPNGQISATSPDQRDLVQRMVTVDPHGEDGTHILFVGPRIDYPAFNFGRWLSQQVECFQHM